MLSAGRKFCIQYCYCYPFYHEPCCRTFNYLCRVRNFLERFDDIAHGKSAYIIIQAHCIQLWTRMHTTIIILEEKQILCCWAFVERRTDMQIVEVLSLSLSLSLVNTCIYGMDTIKAFLFENCASSQKILVLENGKNQVIESINSVEGLWCLSVTSFVTYDTISICTLFSYEDNSR